jgi:hypothetical protein
VSTNIKQFTFCSIISIFIYSTVNAASNSHYDGRAELQCNVNVDCSKQAEVVAKMTKRWAVFSKSTVYGNICFEAIQRVKGIPTQVWSDGIAPNQIGVCNMHI